MADRSLTVILAAEEKLEWDSAECKTPTTPRSRIPEPMTCPPAPLISWPRHGFNATEEELECKTPTEPCYRIPEPTTCPSAPMIYWPRHDFNATEEEFEFETADQCKAPTDPRSRIPELVTCPPAPMTSSPRHDFNANKVFIFSAGSSRKLSPLLTRADDDS